MHRPESWGYVQFSTGRPGTVTLRADPTIAARRWLHAVYYAQHDYRRAHGRWARTLEELGVPPPADETLGEPALETTSSLFEAAVGVRLPGRTERWHIRQDALLWME